MNSFLQKKIEGLCPLFLFIFMLGCTSFSGELQGKKEHKEPSFSSFETCFYLMNLPKNIKEKDIEETAAVFKIAAYKKNSAAITGRQITDKKICFFSDKEFVFEDLEYLTENSNAYYLLTAFFKEDNSSFYGITNGTFVKKKDNTPLSAKLPEIKTISEGVEIKGNAKKIVYFHNYLKLIKINHKFGINNGKLYISVERSEEPRYLLVPYLWEYFVEKKSSLFAGDYAILEMLKDEKGEIRILVPDWKKESLQITPSSTNRIEIRHSILNLPFREEHIVRFFHTLKDNYQNSQSCYAYYSPQYCGADINVRVNLFSSEIEFSSYTEISPEMLFVWVLTSSEGDTGYSDELYANILALKIARKLFTNAPSFLGGSRLFAKAEALPSEEIRKYILKKEYISVFGKFDSSIYSYQPELFSESTTVLPIERVSSFKALYGMPESAENSIVSIVIRSKKAKEELEKTKEILKLEGFDNIILELYEKIDENDSWSSLSISIPVKEEHKIMTLFDGAISKTISGVASIGAVRISKNEE